METNEIIFSEDEIDKMVWDELIRWLNSADGLSPEAKQLFISRSYELRLRIQALMLEIQRKFVNSFAADAQFEEEIRRNIRQSLPYMSLKEKTESLKVLTSTTVDRLERLEAQMAGFDFFNTIEISVQSLSETKVSKELTKTVKAIPSNKRQQLLTMLQDIVKNVDNEEKTPKALTDGTTNTE